MTSAKRYNLHIRVAKKWKENLEAAARLSGKSGTEIVEKAVDNYLDEHFKELVKK